MRGNDGHVLDRTAGGTEGQRPQRILPRPIRDLAHCGGKEIVPNRGLDSHALFFLRCFVCRGRSESFSEDHRGRVLDENLIALTQVSQIEGLSVVGQFEDPVQSSSFSLPFFNHKA